MNAEIKSANSFPAVEIAEAFAANLTPIKDL